MTCVQDGSISEAVAWECPPSQRHLIPDRILQLVLLKHLPTGVKLPPLAGLFDGCLAPAAFNHQLQTDAARCASSALEPFAPCAVSSDVTTLQPASAASSRSALLPFMLL